MGLINFFRNWKESNHVKKKCEQVTEEVLSLSLEQAKEEASALLSDPHKFRCIESPSTDTNQLALLSPILKDFFAKYQKVDAVYGDMRLNRSQIGPSIIDSSFIKIGTDIECELVVRQGQDAIYELDSMGIEEPGYPTVHHLLVAIGKILYGD
ncbi:hypothetical protein L0244_17080 [bacterium]|nr:hypothetical protein [bacterium]